jgi:D-alanyl-lipoteichoic acid acyltransferase DltB (MBOAT superfamily)
MQAHGLWLIATGLAKKIVIGDYLSFALVKGVFETPALYSSLEVLVGVYAYAIKIYCDFSGYTDVAIGSALLFGYRLPPNFDAPYTASDLQDFWRRWHISLSSWLRDYLYIPLGGSRGGALFTYRNLMITMLLGGLWHGASWNFVIWGGLHGLGLSLTRMWQRQFGEKKAQGIGRAVGIVVTFHFVCFAWIFFRAPTFAHATEVIARLAKHTTATTNLTRTALGVLAIGMVTHFVPKKWTEGLSLGFARTPALVQGLVLAGFAYALHRLAGIKPEPFIYGQF